ncbi:MAG: SDR family oxidoreductase [Rubellimicrobium sp.]|nr:SDR family oxidoreductase [Rubellimicrobium sp.]
MRTIIVTGASSGIGRAVAGKFLAEGWRVGLIARRADRLVEMAAGHDAAMPLPCDVTQEDEVDHAFDAFVAEAGRIDVLFNNAGIFTPPAPIDEIPVADWHQAVAVNLTGMFLCARAAFGRMRRQAPQGGRIINNGSISAYAPREGSVTYTTTKHGVTGLTRTLAYDGREFDIACGQIDIGNARTEMVEALIEREKAAGRAVPHTMDVGIVADAVYRMADLPPEANVLFQTVMATKMPFVGRG